MPEQEQITEKREITEREAQSLDRISKTMHLHDAIVAIQTNMRSPKNKKTTAKEDSSFGTYSYRNAEDIIAAVKPFLSTYKLVLSMDDEIVEKGNRFYVEATATLSNGFETHKSKAYAREPDRLAKMSEPQTTGSASSYARKKALEGLFALADGSLDPDLKKNQQRDEPQATEETINKLAKALNTVNEKNPYVNKKGEKVDAFIIVFKKYGVTTLNDLTQAQAEEAHKAVTDHASKAQNA
jgi:hypothetical protein